MEEPKKQHEKALTEEQEIRKMTKMLLNLGMAEMVVDLGLLKDPPVKQPGNQGKADK